MPFGISFKMSLSSKYITVFCLFVRQCFPQDTGFCLLVCFPMVSSLPTDQRPAVVQLHKLRSSHPGVESIQAYKTQLLTLPRLKTYKHCHVYVGVGVWISKELGKTPAILMYSIETLAVHHLLSLTISGSVAPVKSKQLFFPFSICKHTTGHRKSFRWSQ